MTSFDYSYLIHFHSSLATLMNDTYIIQQQRRSTGPPNASNKFKAQAISTLPTFLFNNNFHSTTFNTVEFNMLHSSNIIHHHLTSPHIVIKRVRHVTFNNAELCLMEMLYPIGQGLNLSVKL